MSLWRWLTAAAEPESPVDAFMPKSPPTDRQPYVEAITRQGLRDWVKTLDPNGTVPLNESNRCVIAEYLKSKGLPFQYVTWNYIVLPDGTTFELPNRGWQLEKLFYDLNPEPRQTEVRATWDAVGAWLESPSAASALVAG